MTSDPRRWMWAEACEMLARAERLQRQFFVPAEARPETSQWEPPVDVFETDRGLWITVALPGVDPADLELAVHGDTLIVAGRRVLPPAVRRARLVRLEIPHGRFLRRIRLPAGRYLLAGQELRHGCLTIVLERV